MNKFKQFLIVGTTILVLAVFFSFSKPAISSISDRISGYGWNADSGPSGLDFGGMGWLSFNCTSGGNCSTSNYGVTADSSGIMTGYAWSGNSIDSNINGFGWLKFGGFPSPVVIGSGTVMTPNAKINTDGTVTGWARFCAVFASGCSGDYYHGTGSVDNNLSTNQYLGNWDGWVSLSGSTSTGSAYGVKYDKTTGKFSGYAWGGPDNVGWIDFSKVSMDVVSTTGIEFIADSNVVYPNLYQTTLKWRSKTSTVLTSCVVNSSPYTSTWTGYRQNAPAVTSDFAKTLVTVPSSPTRYDITCYNGSTPVVADSIYISRSDSLESVVLETLGKGSNAVINNKTTLVWTTKNVTYGSCVASSSPNAALWSGSKSTLPAPNGTDENGKNGTGQEVDVSVPNMDPKYTAYTITCKGADDNASVSSSIKLNENGEFVENKKLPRYIEN